LPLRSDPRRQPADPAARVDFETAVRPIVAKHCLECHSQDARKGGLSLATYPTCWTAAKDGPVIDPATALAA
jgi:mono/diheme cytochrome c family protein